MPSYLHDQGDVMSAHDDFAREVNSRMAREWQPNPCAIFFYQDIGGDYVQFFTCRGMHYAMHVDEQLTVYCRRSDDEIIGAKLSHVSALIERAPGIRLEVRDGELGLSVLFMASRWTTATKIEEATKVIYEKVLDVIKRVPDGVRLECLSDCI